MPTMCFMQRCIAKHRKTRPSRLSLKAKQRQNVMLMKIVTFYLNSFLRGDQLNAETGIFSMERKPMVKPKVLSLAVTQSIGHCQLKQQSIGASHSNTWEAMRNWQETIEINIDQIQPTYSSKIYICDSSIIFNAHINNVSC